MKHDKLFLVRILCLIGIAGELLIPNNIIRMLFGLFFAIISVALLLMHKNDIILEESDRKTNYSISIICISVILLLFIIVGYIILKELRVIVLSDSQEIFLSEILVFGFMAIFGNCSKKLPFNKYVGLRLPWTLDDCQTWRYAHMLLYELTFQLFFQINYITILAAPNKQKYICKNNHGYYNRYYFYKRLNVNNI